MIDEGGEPLNDVVVHVGLFGRDDDGDPTYRTYDETTGENGAAHFFFEGHDDAWLHGRVEVRSDEFVSGVTYFQNPPRQPLWITASRGGVLVVEAADEWNRPAECEVLLVESITHDDPSFRAATDGTGRARIGPLKQGDYRLSMIGFEPRSFGSSSVRVVAGEEVQLKLVLFPAPDAYAATGTVVDAQARPIADLRVDVVTGFGERFAGSTDRDGRFRIEAPRSHKLSVIAGHESDEYLTEQIWVDFGLEDIELRLTRITDAIEVEIVVSDATDGAPIAEGAVHLVDRVTGGLYGFSFEAGRGREKLARPRGLDCVVAAPGYRSVRGRLLDFVAPEDGRLRATVELERGIDRKLRVVEDWSGRPLEGVRLSIDGRVVAETDPTGSVLFKHALGPELVALRKPGYETETWDPREWRCSGIDESVMSLTRTTSR